MPGTSRRAFLGSLAAFAFDPERALWIPGRKLISIPPLRPCNSDLVPLSPGDLVMIDNNPQFWRVISASNTEIWLDVRALGWRLRLAAGPTQAAAALAGRGQFLATVRRIGWNLKDPILKGQWHTEERIW